MKYSREFLTGLAASALLITLSGCAGNSMNWPGNSIDWPTTQPAAPMTDAAGKRIPRAQDCLSIKQATPSQFVCNGKVYTGLELRKLREEAASHNS